jgi:putative spermidine/putrescine transport system ATP-binding protein
MPSDIINKRVTGAADGRAKSGKGATVRYCAIEKRYGEVQALNPTTLEIPSGEFFSVIGPSGSGKTTLLGVTVGFITPSAGRIEINGADIVCIPPFHRNIGMVFQSYALFPHMTVMENIAFPLKMRRLPKSVIEERTLRMLSMVRLEGMRDRKPAQLSGGQRQRVALARASVYDPLLLLMDEPLSALDKSLREEMQVEIKQFQQTLGTTVLYVTHDQTEAASMSDRIAIMNQGSIQQIGSPRELYQQPGSRFVASFLGDANIFDVKKSSKSDAGWELQTAEGYVFRALTDLTDNGDLTICVRPECLVLNAARPATDNSVEGIVTSVVFSAGTLVVRVQTTANTVLIYRRTSGGKSFIPEVGDTVFASFSVNDTLVLRV